MSIPSKERGQYVTVRVFETVMEKRTRKVALEPPGRRAIDYVPQEMRGRRELRIIVDGVVLHFDEFETERVRPGQEVIVYLIPTGVEILVGLGISLLLTGISYGVQAALAPALAADDESLDDSATYGFDAISNTVRPGTPIPIIYGEHRHGGHIIEQFTRLARNPPADYGDPQAGELHTLLALATGPIDSVSDVRVNKNPVADYGTTVTVEDRLGENHQAPLDGFRDLTTQYVKDSALEFVNVDGITFTTASEVDRFEITIRFPAGLYSVSDKGVYSQQNVQIIISYADARYEEGTEPWISTGTITLANRTRSPWDWWWRSPRLPRAQYRVKIRRITYDDVGSSSVSTTVVHALSDITEEVLTYPRIALLAVRQLPTNQVSGSAPTYDCLVRGKRVSTWSAAGVETAAGEWTPGVSDNPAWCAIDLLLDRLNGLGAYVTEDLIDFPSFVEWAAFCAEEVAIDEEGAVEPQFRLNMVLDGSMTAIDVLKQIFTTGRANLVQKGNKWGARIEQPEDPVQFFQMSRIHRDSFAAARKARSKLANYFTAQFWNAALDYEQDTLPREDPTLIEGDDQREKSINLLGSTSMSQVNRLLNYFILSNRLSRRSIEFEVGVDAIAMEAGDVFKVAHDVPGWGYSGKILEVGGGGTEIVLDREVTIAAGATYELTAIHASDAIDVVRVTSNPGTMRRIQTSADWSETPLPGIDYSFGAVAASTVLYRCISITRAQDPTKRKIRAVEYDEDVYGEDLTVLPDPSVSRLPDPSRIPSDVTNLRLKERQFYQQDGTLATAIDVHFSLPGEPGSTAIVFWRRVGDLLWEPAGPATSSGYFSISRDVESPGASYEVSVVSVSQTGNRKNAADGVKASITTVGTTRQPSNVVGFTVDRSYEGLVFRWEPIDPVVNFDLDAYEIRNGTNWKTATLIGETRDTKLQTTFFVAGSQTYLLRARNTAGLYSPIDASVVVTVEGRIGENVVLTRQEETSWTGTKEGMTVDSGELLLDTADAIVAWRGMQSGAPLRSALLPGGYGSGFRTRGTYTSEVFEVATVALRCLIAVDVEVDQVDQTMTWNSADLADKTWDSEFARQRAWATAPDDRVAARVEMRFSTTDSADSSFGAWAARPQNIEALVAWAQVRVVVQVTDPSWTVRIKKLQVHFDVPDIVEGGTVSTSAVGTTAVTFEKSFNAEPKVAATVIGATAGDEVFITNKDASGFDIAVRNSGSLVVRTVNFTAVGY